MPGRWLILEKWWDGRPGCPTRLYNPEKFYQGLDARGMITLPDDWPEPDQYKVEVTYSPLVDKEGNQLFDQEGNPKTIEHIERTKVAQTKMRYVGWVDPETGVLSPGKQIPGKAKPQPPKKATARKKPSTDKK